MTAYEQANKIVSAQWAIGVLRDAANSIADPDQRYAANACADEAVEAIKAASGWYDSPIEGEWRGETVTSHDIAMDLRV